MRLTPLSLAFFLAGCPSGSAPPPPPSASTSTPPPPRDAALDVVPDIAATISPPDGPTMADASAPDGGGAAKSAPIPEGMLLVKGGTFKMGADEGGEGD